MNLEELLKKFQSIEARKSYRERSRRLIIAHTKQTKVPRLTLAQILFRGLETGSSIVLAGLLILIIAGGFSVGRFLTPFRFSSLNPEGLKAEAEAIDIQIRLSDLTYNEQLQAESTDALPKATLRPTAKKQVILNTENATIKNSTSSEPEPLGVEATLEELAR